VKGTSVRNVTNTPTTLTACVGSILAGSVKGVHVRERRTIPSVVLTSVQF